jgi:hypothetical protein
MPGSTTNYAFNLPLVNDPIDADLWGGQLNANWTSVDALLGATGVKTGGGLEPTDSLFRVVDNADATKKLAFEVSGVTTGTTRTLTVTDTSLAIPANAAGPSSLVLAEDTDNGTNTVQIIAPAAVTSNQVLTLPDETGTVVTTARVASVTTQGIVELATTAEIRTGTDTGRVVTPVGVLEALGFSNYFQSTNQTITALGSLTIAHGLGRTPVLWFATLICQTAEGGYSVNDETTACMAPSQSSFANALSIVPDATNLNIRFGGALSVIRKDTGGSFTITPTNWRLRIRAWA